MSSTALNEAERVMRICNACRYCEGFCAVFPAMELRRTFTGQDLKYLANLCHNCRDCYYACQYAPPHEFMLNVPKTLAALRLETYREFSWPEALKSVFLNNGWLVTLTTMLCVTAVLLFTLFFQGHAVLFGVHTGENSFYEVIPYAAMVLPLSALALFIIYCFGKGVRNLWRGTGGETKDLFDLQAHSRAVWDVLRLKYLDGGGHGCNYPDDRFSMVRRNFHHAVFYGFMLCLAATTVAFFYDHFLHQPAPYPFFSWPVLLGTVGGLALLVGTGGMLYLKAKMDREPATPQTFGMDVSFTVLLFMISLTGLLLLVFRSTPLMGSLLAIHIGMVLGLFVTMPCGKFIHGIYRYAALVKNAIEQARGKV
ncbi:MAG: tricarballylate utilization 4Fe-4S protein TcuB [Desulfosarcina sp.]|nr:tricarballylate utilization 4Fe-4S protein TcuB [Desulfobacterales bacterium]